MEDIQLVNNADVVINSNGNIRVNTLDIQYEVINSKDIFSSDNRKLYEFCKDRKCLVIISETIYRLYSYKIFHYFKDIILNNQMEIITIKTGEKNKDISNVLNIINSAKSFKLDRKAALIGIGGGILLDIVGFAASMYRRRIDYVRIPTTLIGQVDAGIGIKTGVNYCGTKNFIGAFYPPTLVVNDIDLLKTLSKSDFSAGLSEIVKIGLVCDKYLIEILEEHSDSILDAYPNGENEEVLIKINEIAIVRMLEQLSNNFLEKKLERLVDFGHTFSPFIEESSDYHIQHGHAVALDMAISTELSYQKGYITEYERIRIHTLLHKLGLNLYNSEVFVLEKMWKFLEEVILHRGNKLNLVVPYGIGKGCFIRDIEEISEGMLWKAFESLKVYRIEDQDCG